MLGAVTGPKQVMFKATCVSAIPTISGNEKKFLTTEIKFCSGHQKTKKMVFALKSECQEAFPDFSRS